MARYLLDTNTCIAAMRNQATVVQRMAALPPGDCVISTVTSYELLTGVEKCAKPANERAKLELRFALQSIRTFKSTLSSTPS